MGKNLVFHERIHATKNFYKALFLVLLFSISSSLLPLNGYTQVTDPASACASGYKIGYINGVWTSLIQANQNVEELQQRIGNTYNGQSLEVKLLYNQTGGNYSLQDLVETFAQRANELDATGALSQRWDVFWELTEGDSATSILLDFFAPGLRDKVSLIQGFMQDKNITDFAYWLTQPPTEVDYAAHHVILDKWISSKQKILLVAHSQGNLFLKRDYDYIASKTFSSAIGMVQIAPATTTALSPYVLSDGDKIINGLRLIGGKDAVVPPNLINVAVNPKDVTGHLFVNSYLSSTLYASDNVSLESHVKDTITTALSKLKTSTCGTTYAYTGSDFNTTTGPESSAITGHFQGSVTFNRDMSNFTGVTDIYDVSSYSMTIPGTTFSTTYPSAQFCPLGSAGDVSFTFQNGSIESWYIQTITTISESNCIPGYWANMVMYSVKNSRGRVESVVWFSPDTSEKFSGIPSAPTGTWEPVN